MNGPSPTPDRRIAIIVHGGAHELPPEKVDPTRAGCLEAVREGWTILERGGSAFDAVEAAIRVLEADPTFNAGYGAELNADGDIELDAAIMEGNELKAGAVGAVRGVPHPISVARMLVDEEPVLLVADGARRFAEARGAELCAPEDLITPEQHEERARRQQEGTRPPKKHDTVGCVALDADGRIVAGTSTGGTGSNPSGRVGDSPQIGSGTYADGRLGGVSMTGDGEAIARVVLAKRAIDLMDGRHPEEAAQLAIGEIERVNGEAGCILIDRSGRIGWAHNAGNMGVAYLTAEMDGPRAYVHKDEERAAGGARDAA